MTNNFLSIISDFSLSFNQNYQTKILLCVVTTYIILETPSIIIKLYTSIFSKESENNNIRIEGNKNQNKNKDYRNIKAYSIEI